MAPQIGEPYQGRVCIKWKPHISGLCAIVAAMCKKMSEL